MIRLWICPPMSLPVHLCVLSVLQNTCLQIIEQTLSVILSFIFATTLCGIYYYYPHLYGKEGTERLSTLLKNTQPARSEAAT